MNAPADPVNTEGWFVNTPGVKKGGAFPKLVPFFLTPEAQADLRAKAHSWLGTPFHPLGRVKGAGVDCVHLWAEIMVECGHITGYQFPRYQIDGGHHAAQSHLYEWLSSHPGYVELVPGAPNIPGDLLLYRMGRCAHHLAGCVGSPHGIHCLQGGRVIGMNMDDATFAKRFACAFRPVFW